MIRLIFIAVSVVLDYKAITVPSTGIPIMVNMCLACHEDIATAVRRNVKPPISIITP